MGLDKDTLSALTQEYVIPVFVDLVFRRHPLTRILMDKKKTFNGRQIEPLLEYADPDLCQFTGKMKPFAIGESDPFTTAAFTPRTFTVPLAIPFEDEWDNMGSGKVMDIVVARVKNLKKSADAAIASRLLSRAATGTYEWLSLEDLIGTGDCGGITPADMGTASLWKSHIIDAKTAFEDDASSTGENMRDKNSPAYLYKIIKQGIAKASYMGDKPKLIMMSRYLFDLLDDIFVEHLSGSPISTDSADVGFESIKVQNIPCIPDEDITTNQVNNTDSRIYIINHDYLYFYFNTKATFIVKPFVDFYNVNASVMKILARGGMVISNRAAQCRIDNLYTPKTYAAPAA